MTSVTHESEGIKHVDNTEELQLVKKLQRLSRVSWSPTLRANSEALSVRANELQRASLHKKSGKE